MGFSWFVAWFFFLVQSQLCQHSCLIEMNEEVVSFEAVSVWTKTVKLQSVFLNWYLPPFLFWARAIDDPDLWSLEQGCPGIFLWRSIKHCCVRHPLKKEEAATSHKRSSASASTRDYKNETNLTQSNVIIRALTAGCWRCANTPQWNNHFYQPRVHIRCHTTSQDCSWLQMWGEVIIWILLQERGSVESLILFGHGSGPLYSMQGSWQSNGIFDQHRVDAQQLKHCGTNIWMSATSQLSFFYHADMGHSRVKTNMTEYTTC